MTAILFLCISPTKLIKDKTKKETTKVISLLLGYLDSNQEKQDQNLLCYHYTIAHYLFPIAKVLLFF